ncbi:MAG: 3-dehydroquinate synthase [Microcoleus sp. CAN_BIN18]|nr:3-dehydroquinate synthase [Microcoleus sp. CAN_BIN18]
MQSIIKVDLGPQSYNVCVRSGGLDELGTLMGDLSLGKKVLLVSNQSIFRQYGDRATTALESAGFEVSSCILPPGEQYKTLNSVQKIYGAALANRLERSSTMVALGGGVVGDITGFAAATWLRGINVVQVPTSLLAMVDASIGGKTGVNHPEGKNLIGAFHQPRLVLIDPDVLKTLPAREFRSAMAEVIKYGVIWDVELFGKLEKSKRLDQMRYVKADLLAEILIRSCQAKAEVVSKDEKESGLRAILNYGHTIGHAVESLTNYKVINHGEGVAIGMAASSRLAVELGMWDAECDRRQSALIEKAGLPAKLPAGVDVEEILNTLQLDKKVQDGKVRFVLPVRLGEAAVSDRVDGDVILQVLREML